MKPLHAITTLILAVLMLAAQTCDLPTPTPGIPTPTMTASAAATPNCDATLAPLGTRLAVMDATLVPLETLAADLDVACHAAEDALDVCRMTATAAAMPTATPEPTPAPITDKMCAECATSADCGDGYICQLCGDVLRCVRAYYPQSDCNGCLWQEWVESQR